MHRDVGEGSGEERHKARLGFDDEPPVHARGGLRELRNHAGEHDLIADALLGGDEKDHAVGTPARPYWKPMIGNKDALLDPEPIFVIAPAAAQLTLQKI